MQIGKQARPYRLAEPYHDKEVVDESASPATTTITFYLKGDIVGTKTITVSGTTTTIEVAFV